MVQHETSVWGSIHISIYKWQFAQMLAVGGCWGGVTADDSAQINAIWPGGLRQLDFRAGEQSFVVD